MANYIEAAVSSIAGAVLGIMATAHLARALQVGVFGQFSLVRTISEYMLLASTLGVTVVGARAVATAPHSRNRIVLRVVMVRAAIALTCSAGALIYSVVRPSPAGWSLVLLAGAVALSALNLDWVFSASENTRFPSIVRVASRAFYAALVFMLVRGPGDLFAASMALGAEMILVSLVVFGAIGMNVTRASVREAISGIRPMLKLSFEVGTGQIARQLKTNIDLLMLGVLATTAAVGYYAAAYRLVMFVNMLAGSFATVLMPRLARVHSVDRDAALKSTVFGLRMSVVLAAGVAAVGVPTGSAALVGLFGSQYRPASGVMTILMIAASFLFVSMTLGNIALAIGRQRDFTTATIAAALLNIALNLVAIPRWGIEGAAAVTLVTEVFLAAWLGWVLRHDGVVATLRSGWVARVFLTTVASTGLAVLLRDRGVHWAAVLLASGGAFAMIALALRVVDVVAVRRELTQGRGHEMLL